jgi:FAD/FMN-containing dehydrogenase
MRFSKNRKTHNWNIYPVIEAQEKAFYGLEDLRKLSLRLQNYIPRGSGRSYGDNSLSKNILSTRRHNKILSFDKQRGIVKCQAGTTIEDILEVIIPHGWFIAVTPGTKFVSIGGAIAADVHGKNHHKEGSFSNHLESILLMLANGEVITCSKNSNRDLFWATCGGMGLTGVILEAEFHLKPIETSYVTHTSIKARDLEEMFRLLEEHNESTYSVAWIDSTATGKDLGRGLLYIGEHVRSDELIDKEAPLSVIRGNSVNIPFFFPNFTLNPWSIYLFNQRLYHKQKTRTQTTISDYDRFFYPLDSIHNWNRMYGRRGFMQYQYVIPKENGERGVRKTLKAVSNSKLSAFFAGLKLFGKQDDLISFPMEGYTFGVDLPVTKGLLQFLEILDEMVLDLGGRLYLAKDARMSRKVFLQGYPNSTRFMELVKTYNPDYKIQSLQSKRLGITA